MTSANKEKLLVVDYEPEVLDSVKPVLSSEGYAVLYSQSGQDALSIIRKKLIDLIITSCTLPDLSGPEFLQQAHLISPSTGSIVMCRHDSIDLLTRSFQAGAQAIVLKPINVQQLKTVVAEVLHKNRLAKENMRLRTLLPLFEVNKSLISELNSNKIFSHIVRIACIETRAEKVSLMLLNDATNDLVVKAALGLSKAIVGKSLQSSHDDIPWSVIKTGRAIIVNAKPKHVMTDEDSGVTSSLSVPLSIKGKVIGVINCSKSSSRVHFTESDLELLTILAGQAAAAIENAKLFADIQIQKSNVETFLRKSLTAQEDERRRISVELHDGLAQRLVSASYATQLSSTFMSCSRLEEAREEINRASSIINETIKELRRVIVDLHPIALAELGLVEAIRQHVATFGKETGVLVSLEISGHPKPLSSTQDMTIYRTCLEALNNARKHACASNVKVSLGFEPEYISVEIVDDGRGFNLDEAQKRESTEGHLGLVSMEERAKMIGSMLEINTAPGEGTQILMRVPCPSTADICCKIQS